MEKTYRSVIFWGLAAVVCLVLLAMPSYAASVSDIPGYRLGPGDHYDEAGNTISLDGRLLVRADGTIVDADLDAEARRWIQLKEQEEQKKQEEQKTQEEQGTHSGISEAPPELKTETPAKTAPAAAAAAETAPAKPASEPAPAAYTVSSTADGTVYTYEGKKYKARTSYGVHKLSGYNPTPEYGYGTYSGRTARPNHTIAAASDLPIGTVVILKGSSGPYPKEFDGVYVVEDRGGYHIEQEGWIDIFFGSEAEAAHVTDAGWNYAEVWIAEEVK